MTSREIRMNASPVNMAHVISSESPQQFRKLFYEFIATEGYEIENFQISTNAVLLGANQIGNGRAQANIIIIISAYIEFTCSQEKAEAFNFKQSLIKK